MRLISIAWIVEGGAQLINSFLIANLWDEARVYTADQAILQGIKAPVIQRMPARAWKISNTLLQQYFNP